MTDTSSLTIQELKPCPFCGSTEITIYGNEMFAACENCQAQGPVSLDPEETATEAWNIRQVPSEYSVTEINKD